LKKVAIMADSTCCLPQELIQEYDIHLLSIHILHEDKSYRDRIDISPGEVYKIMRKKENLPTTSTPSPGDFLDAYRQLSQKAENIFCITVTALQSKTFEAASLAKQIAIELLPNTHIEVFDSRAVAGALGFITLEAAKAASREASLDRVIEVAKSIRDKVNALFMLDTLYYLARTGRIARAAAWAGKLLNLKPVLEHAPAIGETTPVARPRNRENAIKLMLKIMADRVRNSRVHAMVHHADDLEEGEKLMKEIGSRFDCAELYMTEFTPGMGVHTGPGLLGITFYTD
jgi:DegV family protein with EDD domain